MSEIRLNIDGREVRGHDGQTVLDIARQSGINIPTLCHDDRVKMYGSCGICVVEAEGNPRLLRSCSTIASDGMIIKTNTERVRKSRKTALELLLSDHTGDCRPPCVLACPAGTDCQGYVGLIAMGEYNEAVKLIKDKIPLPGSIGRVCPHPCEEACRRQNIEEPIAIADLKRFAADIDMSSGELYTGGMEPDTGKKVAIIGGGPGGLTAAYFLRRKGHSISIYDRMPHMGGMLRYGIPEYRLPKAYLQKEIEAIENMGVKFYNNIRVGKDLSLDWLRENNDAVMVAVGAWTSMALRCPGEELEGVIGGIDFLRGAALGALPLTGSRIAVVGGGNTAMDACRTAVRLGADKVYNVYRRTKAEMPAEETEITEAEEEGVIFKNLTNPIEVVGENGKAKALRLQIMELGEPDASGRRAPVPVEGKEEILDVDTVIVAIGQGLDPLGLEALEQTRRRTIAADEATFRTSLEGVFAIGDATNKGADIAIAAMGEAKKAVEIVDKYLFGEEARYEPPFLVTSEPGPECYSEREKIARVKMPHRPASARNGDFLEINCGLTEDAAKAEAARCLECGCHDYFECKLIDYANQYKVQPEKYDGKVHHRISLDEHPFIRRNPDKCILCGLCVRICDEVIGSTALGLVDRGFDTVVKPALDLNLRDTDCIACGQCVHACPTGALTETMMTPKQVPLHELKTRTTCSFCGVGCQTELTHAGGQLIRGLPVADRPENALLCMKGRFGFGEIAKTRRLVNPLIRNESGELREASFDDTYIYISKKLQAVKSRFGGSAVGVAVSARYTNEEIFLIKEYANKALGTDMVFSFGKTESGLADTLGADASTADFEELTNTGLIILVNTDIKRPHLIAGLTVKKAVKNGAGLIVLNGFDSDADGLADIKLNPGKDLSVLKEILKAVVGLSPSNKSLEGYDGLVKELEPVIISDGAAAVAEAYVNAKKSVIIFEQDGITADAARLLGDIALAAGKSDGARNGIIQLKPSANSQGLADLGVLNSEDVDISSLKGLVIFGEDVPDKDLSHLEFLAVHELHLTTTASKADAVLPAQSFAEVQGCFTNTVGQANRVNRIIPGPVPKSNFEVIGALARFAGYPLPYRNEDELFLALQRVLAPRPAKNGPMLIVPSGNNFLKERVNTNALHNSLMDFAAEQGL